MNIDKLDTISITSLDLTQPLAFLSFKYSKVFIPPPAGLYVEGHSSPILVEGETYLCDSKKFVYHRSLHINRDIYNTNDELILDYNKLSNLLTITPDFPIVERKFLVGLIESFINGSVIHSYNEDYSYLELLDPAYSKEEILDAIETDLKMIRNRVCEFIGSDEKSVYQLMINRYQLMIVKRESYQILEWFMYKEKERLDKLNECSIE